MVASASLLFSVIKLRAMKTAHHLLLRGSGTSASANIQPVRSQHIDMNKSSTTRYPENTRGLRSVQIVVRKSERGSKASEPILLTGKKHNTANKLQDHACLYELYINSPYYDCAT